mgnify:CR=1 FL=1
MTNPIRVNSLYITSGYGNRTYEYQGKMISDFHHGIDLIDANGNNNADVVAFADGVVTSVVYTGEQYGTGCYVRLAHDNGLQTMYYHLKSGSIVVNVGDYVKEGQKLGVIGTTGQSTGIHLHFQIDKGSSASSINPYPYLFEGKEFMPKAVDPFPGVSDKELAKRVWKDEFGKGDNRRAALGIRYDAVQALVDQGYGKPEDKPKEQPKPKTIALGDTVIVNGVGTAASTGEGARTINYVNQEMKVIMIAGNTSRPNRYALNQYNKGVVNDPFSVSAWFSINDIKKK